MTQPYTKYYCNLCHYGCEQASQIETHKLTTGHLEKCSEMLTRLKSNKSLYNKYIAELNIHEEYDKTMYMLRQEIIDRLSTTPNIPV